jgi:hypothetical protein
MNLATIMIGNAVKNLNIIPKNAADAYLNIMKYNAVNMFHNTIAKHAAAMFLNTTVFKNAECAKNGFAIANVNMFQNTIGNILANNHNAALLHKHAALQLATPAAADNRNLNKSLFYCSQVKFFHLTFF